MKNKIYKAILKQSPQAFISHNFKLNEISGEFEFSFFDANDSFYRTFQIQKETGTDQLINDFILNRDNKGFSWVQMFKEALPGQKVIIKKVWFERLKVWLKFKTYKVNNHIITTIVYPIYFEKEFRSPQKGELNKATIKKHRKNLETLLEVSNEFISIVDYSSLIKVIVDKGIEIMKVNCGILYILDNQKVDRVESYPKLPSHLTSDFKGKATDCFPLLTSVVSSQELILIKDTAKAQLSEIEFKIVQFYKCGTLLSLPLVIKGRVVGVLSIGKSGKTKYFSSIEMDIWLTLARQAVMVLKNIRMYEKMRRISGKLLRQNDEFIRVNNELTANYKWIQDINRELTDAKTRVEENEQKLINTRNELKLKLDYLLSPEMVIENPDLSDLFEIEHLQTIQDSFAYATGVASVITNSQVQQVTSPSNFNRVCEIIKDTEKGKQDCINCNIDFGNKSLKSEQPVVEKCYKCGFLVAVSPIFIGNHLVAYWIINQASTNGNESVIYKYAGEIGANKDLIMAAVKKLEPISPDRFNYIASLLWIIASDLSVMAYNNLLLARKVEEQKDYEARLIISKEMAEESDRLKTAFLQNMSHEIRTPLNGILGFSQLLKRDNLPEKKRNDYTSLIIDSANRLMAIVNDIIDISRLEAGDIIIKSEPVCLSGLLNNLYKEFKDKTGEKVILFGPVTPHTNSSITIISDGERLKQVLEKLISNAIKFTSTGEIKFGLEKKGDKLRFFVEDTGIGIPSGKIGLIFKPFYQADMDETREFDGNGLGLTIASRIVEKMGSKILVNSTPGCGSLFYFEFEPNQIIFDDVIYSDNGKISGLRKNYSIIVAEDEIINFLFIKDALEDNCDDVKFTIYHAKTGLEVIDLLKKYKDISLILMDIKMPSMDGITATRFVRKEFPGIPVIAQTALALSNEHKKAMEAGCDAYLTKPIKREYLIQTIYSFINK